MAKFMLMKALFSMMLMGALCLFAPSMASPAVKEKQIVLFYSYGHGGKGIEIFDSGLLSTLRAAGVRASSLYFEYLDIERHKDDTEYLSRRTNSLLRKYKKRKIDLIITVQQPAQNFILQEGKQLAPGAPVVSVQAPLPSGEAAAGRRFICLVSQFDIQGTLDRMLELFPQTRRVVFVAGSSEADRKVAAQAENVAGRWKNRIAVESTSGLSLEELLTRVSNLSAHTLILFTQFNRDAAGRAFLSYEVEGMVAQAANVPVFGLYDFNLYNGGIGGSVISVKELGEKTGSLALDILDRKLVLAQPVTSASISVKPMFDWNQIARWEGMAAALPSESVFINKPLSLWAQYRDYVVLFIVIVLLQSALIVALYLNVRNRKKAQKHLSVSEDRYRVLVESAPDAILVYDADQQHFVDANRNAEKLFGCGRDKLLQSTPLDFYPRPPSFAQVEKSFNDNIAAVLSGTVILTERSVRTDDGRDLLCELRLVRLPSEDRRLIRASFIDITARKHAEEELKNSWRIMASAMEHAPIPMVLISMPDGVMRVVNTACRKVLCMMDDPDPVGTRLMDFAPAYQDFDEKGNQTPFHEAPLALALQGKATANQERRIVTRDGMTHWVMVSGTPIYNESGTLIAAYLVFPEITELKVKEKIIEEKSVELERFTYTVSHDLKSPLVTIKTFLGFLEHDLEKNDTEKAKTDIAFMHNASDKMVSLLHELLELSRVGRVVHEPAPASLRELADEAAEVVAGSIAANRVNIRMKGADVKLFGDRQRLGEIWQNLIENAVKYMGGQEQPRIELGAEGVGPETVFFVRDNGMGIDPRHQSKVFGLFDKLDPKSEGSGLGLALVKRIVEMYQGKIWVESEGVGKGSTFKFTIPNAISK